ncbi:MAG: hypothetical protein J0G30_09155 [Actinomycetales bacterium]|nr:hypothetical protein [Actinomycetales bacterium]
MSAGAAVRIRRSPAGVNRGAVLGLLGLAALALTGCSQIAAIAPVGGDHLAEVRYAAIDLLLHAQVDVLTAPVCTQSSDDAVSCTGTTVDGATITVDSPADDPTVLTVTVGSEQVYSGSIQDVLEKAMAGS